MQNTFRAISSKQFTRSRRQIYINSIGKIMDRELSCHIDKDKKRIVYKKKQYNLFKALQHLIMKVEKNSFGEILKFANVGLKQKRDTVFLPQALLKNERQTIRNFRQKLSVGQVDRYISLHIPKSCCQSTHFGKSQIFQSSTVRKKQEKSLKDRDSTYMDNKNKKSCGLNTVSVIKIKQHKSQINGAKILQFNVSSKEKTTMDKFQLTKSKSNQKKKRDIIHITYTQYCLGSSAKKNSASQRNTTTKQDSKRVSDFHINEFTISDFPGEIKPKKEKDMTVECESFFSTSENVLKQLKQCYSPFIGKNRAKNSQIKHFQQGRQFGQINIEY